MRRIPLPVLALAISGLLPVAASAAPAPSKTFTVVAGETRLRGDEQVCFRLTDDRRASDRLVVRIRFAGAIPGGRLSIDGVRSDRFSRASEEISFTVDPRGTHRLKLEMEDDVTVSQLSIASTESMVARESCATYDVEEARRVDLEVPRDESTNVFETPEERADREARERADREARERAERESAPAPTTPSSTPPPSTSGNSAGIVPSDTEMSLTLQTPIDTRTAYAGQVFTTYLSQDVVVNGRVVLPSGARVEGRVLESKDAGRFGRSSLKLGFDRAYLADGTGVPMQAQVDRVGKGSAAKQGGIIAGSAVGGAILGKVLGGDDKDALLGAILGGAIAAGSIGAKEGESINLPAGTVMTVRTQGTIDVPASQPPRR